MKSLSRILGMLIAIPFIYSCGGDDDLPADYLYAKNGIVHINILGNSIDGIPLNESLVADKYLTSSTTHSTTLSEYGNTHNIAFIRYIDDKGLSSINFSFRMQDKEIIGAYVGLFYFKKLDENNILELEIWENSPARLSIANYEYDSVAATVKGDYAFDYYYNDNKILTVNGDFDINLVRSHR